MVPVSEVRPFGAFVPALENRAWSTLRTRSRTMPAPIASMAAGLESLASSELTTDRAASFFGVAVISSRVASETAISSPSLVHAADGSGYDFVADWLIRMDAVNPQTAARMTSLFETWPRYDAGRRARARAALERIAARPGLSRNTAEMVTRILAAGG